MVKYHAKHIYQKYPIPMQFYNKFGFKTIPSPFLWGAEECEEWTLEGSPFLCGAEECEEWTLEGSPFLWGATELTIEGSLLLCVTKS